MQFSHIALALGLLAAGAASAAQASVIAFTNSNLAGLPSALVSISAQAPAANLCVGSGVCATSLSYQTAVGGLTVTATDGPDVDTLALVSHSNLSNAGLGVVAGYIGHKGSFVIADGNHSLDEGKEVLTLRFANQVSLSQLFFFPDDRSTLALNKELDAKDGFTLSVDGGAFQEHSFGSLGGHPVSFQAPLVGQTFSFGYARHKSPEDFYLAGMSVTATAPAVPEASSVAMMGLGLLGLAGLASRRQQRG
nr:PEP-CTERM sorting domain-containing protein [uncultured Aquabacterium sp.]